MDVVDVDTPDSADSSYDIESFKILDGAVNETKSRKRKSKTLKKILKDLT